MKRILSVILVMALLMCLGTSAFAATTMSTSSTALQNGDKVYVTVALDAAMQDVTCFDYHVNFNPAHFTLTGSTQGYTNAALSALQTTSSGAYYGISYLDVNNSSAVTVPIGPLYTLEFTVNAETTASTDEFTLTRNTMFTTVSPNSNDNATGVIATDQGSQTVTIAAREAASKTVYFTFRDGSETVVSRTQITVTEGFGASNGYPNCSTLQTYHIYANGYDKDPTGSVQFNHIVPSGEVTVMDALIKMHVSKGLNLAANISGSNRYLTKIFGHGSSNIGFTVNNVIPRDSAGIGYAANECILSDGSEIVFFTYSDTDNYSDYYTYFDKDEYAVAKGKAFTLTLMGYPAMSETAASAIAISGATVYMTDGDGVRTNVGTTGTNGTVSCTIPSAGTYTLSAEKGSFSYEIVAPEATVTAYNIKYGDVNGDTKIDGNDYSLVVSYCNGQITFTTEQFLAADVNGDGVVNSTDQALFGQYLAGTISKFPVEE